MNYAIVGNVVYLSPSGSFLDTTIMPDGWGCHWCVGTGYEDYPSMKKQCRISGHEERSKKQYIRTRAPSASGVDSTDLNTWAEHNWLTRWIK